MKTTADKLNHLINTKEGIRQEINRAYETEEISTSDTFNSYIQKLEEHPYYIMRYIERSIENIKLSNALSIGEFAFYGCSSLTSVSFPNVTSIGDYAFNSCSNLTSVSFPVATSTGVYAFSDCTSLTSVSFPVATSVGTGAFQNCSSLTSVSFPVATSIGQEAFDACSSLTEVTEESFPNATSIGERAFNSCSSLTSVSFPKVTIIGEYAFRDCSSLTSVSFPLITGIGSSVFYSCSSLTEVSFPKVTSINDHAFYNCSGLTSVSFPVATSIGNYAFQSCSSLTEVSFPKVTSIAESILSIGSDAFRDCSGLTKVSFPKAINIGSNAFYGCSGLTEVTDASFPEVTKIGNQAFQNCSSLTSVSFPKVTSIGERAFSSCSGLTRISFPVATSISIYAFRDCSSLTTIYVGTNTSTVCTLSSTNAIPSSVTDIYVPSSLVDSYKSATNWSTFASKIKSVEQPLECISLSITADDATGRATSTTVYYTAECTYTKEGVPQEGTKVFTGKAISDSFEQNTSTTDTVQRTVSFTFLGQTATTTITQGVWVNSSISVTTEGISKYGWVTADSTYNVDGYDVYMSNNKGVNNSQAVMKLECIGYTDLTIYIRSYAEGSYDYTIASIANASTYPIASNSSGAKASTRAHQKSGITLSDYTAVTYTGLKDNDIIYIVFTKDSSTASGDDRGYVLIPKA